MFDKIASVGAAFDWITPLITVIQDFRNRPSVGYSVPVDAGWSAYMISDLLHDYGVKHWGLHIYDTMIIFRLRVAQAPFAQYLFEQNGIVYYGGVDPAEVAPAPEKQEKAEGPAHTKSRPAKRQAAGAMFDGVLNDVDRITKKLSNT